jgi:hypothetical protein
VQDGSNTFLVVQCYVCIEFRIVDRNHGGLGLGDLHHDAPHIG